MLVKKNWVKIFSSLNNFGLEKNWDKQAGAVLGSTLKLRLGLSFDLKHVI